MQRKMNESGNFSDAVDGLNISIAQLQARVNRNRLCFPMGCYDEMILQENGSYMCLCDVSKHSIVFNNKRKA